MPELAVLSAQIETEEINFKFRNKNEISDGEKDEYGLKIKFRNLVIQNSGFLFGFIFMFVLALLSKQFQI